MPPSPSPEQLRRWDRSHVWHAFTQMAEYEPLLLERGEGCYVEDLAGRRYLDGVSSLWCNLHGHRHPKIDAAIRRQLDQVAHVTNLGSSNSTTIRLAKRLVELANNSPLPLGEGYGVRVELPKTSPHPNPLPKGEGTFLDHVFFSDDGATAVEVAVKMALQYWRQRRTDPRPEKTAYLALGEAYHGDTLGSVSVGGVERFHAMFRPLLFTTYRVTTPETYRTPPGVAPENLAAYYLDQLEAVLREHHRKIAAMVVEPLVQAAAGMVTHPAGYLRGVRELTRKYDILLIADEVAVGFGRTGKMFACQHEDVTPDFLCLAKGLTGGYLPMAATLTTNVIWEAFLGTFAESRTFFHGHTYGGNPLGAASALASLEIFEEERVLENLPPKIARLAEHLRRIKELPFVGDCRQRGLIAGIELVRDKETKEPFPWKDRRGVQVCDHARTEGVLLRPLGNVIVVFPPLAITCEQIDVILTAVEHGIRRLVV
ncbi:MAG: aspartate aminotransferase family protein [Pirellulales bacterium]|nr:aspartate aminotransferase family protein [Pirellulales bacterium]